MEDNHKARVSWFGRLATKHKGAATKVAAATNKPALKERLAPAHQLKLANRPAKAYLKVVLTALVMICAGWVLSSLYLSKLTIGSQSVPTHQSDAVLADALNKQIAAYQMPIGYPNATIKKYPLKNLSLTLDIKDSLQITRRNQHKLNNRLAWWRPLPASLVFQENTPALNNFVANDINVVVQPSKDASLSIANGDIELSDAITGKQYGLSRPEQTLLTAANNLQTESIKLQTLQINPALTASLLQPYKALLEKTINQPAGFTIGGQTVKPLPAEIASWLDISSDDKSKKLNITVNSGKVEAYINSIAASAIHPAKAQVDISQPDGTTQVLVPGINGVDVLNKTGVATSVSNSLLTGSGFNFSLPVSYQPFQTITAGSYPKWIEVDLTNKRLYAYEYANLVQTDLVTAGAPATPTVTGQYSIYAKYDQQNMSGENVDGSSYFQPNVPWVNYFYKDYAIHGNYWRPLSYFGNINSSHGCVGLVDSDALWIYNWAPIGTPVIIHA